MELKMLNKSNVAEVVPGAVEGARSATGSAPGAAAEAKRWSANRKKEVVLRLLRGEPVDAISRGPPGHWRAGDGSREPGQGKAGPTPFRQPEVAEMSRATSTGTGKPYGLQRVCRVLGFPRSTIYAGRARASSNVVPLVAQRRGPKPKMPDADLLEAIRADLAASPFTGEGHRKVWARLRILRDIRVSRTRVLRLMRENALLSPHRRPQGKSAQHGGTITTNHPNEMWGTDGVRIETVDDGWVWVFSAIDHCDACCVGIHAVKTGNRFAA